MSFQIGSKIDTEASFSLDIKDIVNGRTFLASITRYGKSWTCRKVIEEVFGHCGIVIIDPEGEYSSLREKYPFLIIGIDVPIQIETAEFMAEQVLKNDLSVILDTSKERDDKEYVRKFLEQFFYLETTARRPYLLVVEEAEDYAPEKGAPGSAECLPALIAFAKKGGKRGIGCIFVGHRPAWISKGILSQCSNKALGKIESTDFKALEEYARVPRSIIERLPDLKPGEFCFTGDWVKDLEQVSFVKVGSVKTTHLGMTPEIIPPSPKALESVIDNLQRSLAKVIESVKPKVESISETETRLRKKFEDEVTAVKRTADEKAERKYRAEIENLKNQLGEISRSAALQAQTPISDVLEHPIVKARTTQLDQRARDVLTKIEREPGLTREHLAAFLSASTNTVANIVDQINRVFKAQVIVDDGGRPIKYRSMLKRLYLTDVARREIDELNQLQQTVQEMNQTVMGYKTRLTEAQANATQWKDKAESTEKMYEQLQKQTEQAQIGTKKRIDDLEESEKKLSARLEVSKQENERLDSEVKRLKSLSKIGEAIEETVREVVKASQMPTVVETPLKEDIESLKVRVKEIDKKIQTVGAVTVATDSEAVTILRNQISDLGKKIEELAAKPTGDTPGAPFELDQVIRVGRVVDVEKPFKFTTETLEGRIMALAKEGPLTSWKRQADIEKMLVDKTWGSDRLSVGRALEKLVNDGYLGTRKTDRLEYKLAINVRFIE